MRRQELSMGISSLIFFFVCEFQLTPTDITHIHLNPLPNTFG